MNRRGDMTPASAIARLTINNPVTAVRRLAERHPWKAIAIIGASIGRTGTRNRAGALDPPHHMYIRVELATNATTVAVSAMPNSLTSDRSSIIQHPAIATA